MDISDLSSQATGLLPTSVIMISPERETLAKRDFAVDVQGSVVSVYGTFGLIMAGITAVVWPVCCWRSGAGSCRPTGGDVLLGSCRRGWGSGWS